MCTHDGPEQFAPIRHPCPARRERRLYRRARRCRSTCYTATTCLERLSCMIHDLDWMSQVHWAGTRKGVQHAGDTCHLRRGQVERGVGRIGNGNGNYAHQRQVSDSSQRHVVRCKEKAIDERSEVAAQRESERESCFWFLQLALQGFGDWPWLGWNTMEGPVVSPGVTQAHRLARVACINA